MESEFNPYKGPDKSWVIKQVSSFGRLDSLYSVMKKTTYLKSQII
jgi:hypothetical protein